jgi:hypothetical protein
MSDREEEDFGFEVEPEKKKSAFDADEEFIIGSSDDDDEEFSLGGFDDDTDFGLSPENEERSIEVQPEDAAGGDLFSIGDEEPVSVIDEDQDDGQGFLLGAENSEPSEQKSSSSRLLLLVGLLVVLGAAIFYFMGLTDEPVAPVPVQVETKKQPIPQPSKPLVTNETVASANDKTEAPVAMPAKVEETPTAAVEQVVPVEVVKAEAPAVVAAKVAEPVKPEAAKPVADGVVPRFQVQVGAYLLSGNLKQAEKEVRQLGFEPRRSEATKMTSMVRLKLGNYPAAEGPARLAELKKSSVDAFLLYTGEMATIYAGSYLSLDKARRQADLLWEKGIRVEEVKADVEVPLHRLSFGGFADKASAAAAAQKARATGLDAQVVAYKEF